MQVYLTSPDGDQIGPFRTDAEAVEYAQATWPSAIASCRDEDPGCYEMEIVPELRDLKRLAKARKVKTDPAGQFVPAFG